MEKKELEQLNEKLKKIAQEAHKEGVNLIMALEMDEGCIAFNCATSIKFQQEVCGSLFKKLPAHLKSEILVEDMISRLAEKHGLTKDGDEE